MFRQSLDCCRIQLFAMTQETQEIEVIERSSDEYTYLVNQIAIIEFSIRNLQQGALSPLDHMTTSQLKGLRQTTQECLSYLEDLQEIVEDIGYLSNLLQEQINVLEALDERVGLKLGDYQG
jgi:hypothetical protein